MKKKVIGGQAVIEGVMMQSPTAIALAVRVPNGSVHIEELKAPRQYSKSNWRSWPFVRGVWRMGTMLALGMSATHRSADLAYPEQAGGGGGGVTVAVAVIIALSVFIALPTFAAGYLADLIAHPLLLNLAEGALRLLIFLGYLLAISRLKDIRRVFMYHGAEHKVVHCYEKGMDLTVENASGCSRLHPRCGTGYLLLVVILSVLLFALLGWNGAWYVRVGLRILILPVVMGVAYEWMRLAASHDSAFWRAVRYPGLQLQRLTTREPETDMLEVAIAAFERSAGAEEIAVE